MGKILLWIVMWGAFISSILCFIQGNFLAGIWALDCFILASTLVSKEKVIEIYRKFNKDMFDEIDNLFKNSIEHTEKDNMVVGIDIAIPKKKVKK